MSSNLNETKINAMIQTLVQQRDSNANEVVNLIGEIAVLKEELEKLKASTPTETST